MLVVIDNYDSFTYNLVQAFGKLGESIKVFRNNKVTLQEIKNLKPDKLVISPGPCTPNEAGISNEAIKKFAGEIPILGVCLGHQCIGQVFGGKIARTKPMHGKTSLVKHDGKTIFNGLQNPFVATRYHSLVVEQVPECLEISARVGDIVMGLRHKEFKIEGVQFHPESFLTLEGEKILKNFMRL